MKAAEKEKLEKQVSDLMSKFGSSQVCDVAVVCKFFGALIVRARMHM